jgi:predicted phosphodiesterase
MTSFFAISDIHVDHWLGLHPGQDRVKMLLEPHLVPADRLILAGDIGSTLMSQAAVLKALGDLYERVYWVPGNHDFWVNDGSYRGDDSVEKIEDLEFMAADNAIRLHGQVEEGLIGGTTGWYDFKYSEKHFGITELIMLEFWRTQWSDGIYCSFDHNWIKKEEDFRLGLVTDEAPSVVVTHIPPVLDFVKPYFHNKTTGFFTFAGYEHLAKLQEGSYWVFGHTHDCKKEVYNGIHLLCNPFGYPGGDKYNDRIPKEEFFFKV